VEAFKRQVFDFMKRHLEAFRRLVRNPKTPAKLLRGLVKVPAHVPVEDWEAVVLHHTAA
jgi:hypothetical protein